MAGCRTAIALPVHPVLGAVSKRCLSQRLHPPLSAASPSRPFSQLGDPDVAAKLAVVISSFRDFAAGTRAFTLVLDDPGGNSFLENPAAPGPDPRAVTHFYERDSRRSHAD